MKNYKSDDDGVLNLVAPAGGVTSGVPVLIGGLLGFEGLELPALESGIASSVLRLRAWAVKCSSSGLFICR